MPGLVGRMSEDAGEFTECEVNTLIAPDRTTIQVRSSIIPVALPQAPEDDP